MPKRRLSEPARACRDDDWLKLSRAGLSAASIAWKYKVCPRTVQLGLRRARDEAERIMNAPPPPQPSWLELVPLFPITSLVPASKCPHHGPIRPGSLFCCMVCHQSGRDDHRALRRDPATEPRPAPKPIEPAAEVRAEPERPKPKGETRRERRKRLYGGGRTAA